MRRHIARIDLEQLTAWPIRSTDAERAAPWRLPGETSDDPCQRAIA